MATGQLILLTGTTGSGKTTACKEFVAQAQELWLHFGADQFLGGVVPRKFVDGGPRCQEGLRKVLDDANNPHGPRHLELGPLGMQMINTFHAMVAAGVSCGSNIIVDHITTSEPPFLQNCLEHFQHLPVLFVALNPPIEVIPKRLDERLDKIVNSLDREQAKIANQNTKRMAEFLHQQIFNHDEFDLVLDSSLLSPQQIANRIEHRLQQGPGSAFPRLCK